MHDSLLECPICYEAYNLDTNIPRIMCCGHTLCSRCINRIIDYQSTYILKCPLDNIPIQMRKLRASSFPKNIAIIRLIEKVSDTVFCTEHNKRLQWFYSEDNTALCAKCLVLGGHKMHQVKEYKPSLALMSDSSSSSTKKRRHNQIVYLEDQPSIIIRDEIYEKIQLIKTTLVKFAGIMFAVFLLLHPFFRLFFPDNHQSSYIILQ